jgi:membrane-bound metal-dependent hydrolase YbcI (DUF457 family)
MDIVSHALAGAAAGAAFGRPFLGAFFGVLPDVVLGIKRRAVPSLAYDFTHSLAGLFVLGFVGTLLTGSIVPQIAIISHLVLDIPTHGEQWAPPLLFPFDRHRFSYGGEEWEWFNPVWCFGFLITMVWSSIWFSVALM